jgi:D-alanyl-D-alanine carboxypeptidase
MVDIPDDIPVAKRESSVASQPDSASKLKKGGLQFSFWWVGLAAIALVSGSLSAWYLQEMQIVSASPVEPLRARTAFRESFDNSWIATLAGTISSQKTLLGHRQYDEAPPETLVPIVADGSIKLRESAARSFMQMVAAARANNVIIVPVSGFRTIEQQRYLFFDIKRQSGLRADERAEVSAPPGYSEHHTGYAIDVVDGKRPDIGLVEALETTEAFQWMEANASRYSFELSFERGNGNVAYEPWHWRFVGDSHSLETFYGTTSPAASSPDPQNPNDQAATPEG